jgi:hypothetical protein
MLYVTRLDREPLDKVQLKKPGQNYDKFLETLRTYSNAELAESSYVVSTSDSPTAVYEKLRKHMDQNDYIFIMSVSKPYQGYGAKAAVDWLAKHLP